MAISEIEKLERRHAENPQGYSFAPLAEAYRKSADHSRALDVLRKGLELHPDYVPASIVLGRVHLDLEDDSSAEAAFSHVLTLDPENVIALKAMADITERASKPGDAVRWLELLLAVDRSNEEARTQFERLVASRSSWPEPMLTDAAPLATELPDEAPVGTLEQAFEAATSSGATAVGTGEILADEAAPPVPDPAMLSLRDDLVPPVPESVPHVAGLQAADAPLAEAASLESGPPVEGLESPLASFVEEGLSSTAESHPNPSHDRPAHSEFQLQDMSQEFGFELRSSGANEFQLPSASDEFASLRPAAEHNEYQLPDASGEFARPRASEPPAEPPRVRAAQEEVPAPPPVVEPASVEAPSWDSWGGRAAASNEPVELKSDEPVGSRRNDEPPAFPEPEIEPPPPPAAERESAEPPAPAWATAESSAEPEAADAPEAGDDPAYVSEPEPIVTEGMAELFLQQGHRVEALRVYRELLMRRPDDARLAAKVVELERVETVRTPQPVSRSPFAADATGGTSVRELLRAILVSRPVSGEAAEAAAGAPGPKGDDAGGAPTRPAPDHLSLSQIFGDEGPPLPPAVRVAPTPPNRSGVSFDEFYGSNPAATGNRESTVRRDRSPTGGDDLDQFHSWLQNLKR